MKTYKINLYATRHTGHSEKTNKDYDFVTYSALTYNTKKWVDVHITNACAEKMPKVDKKATIEVIVTKANIFHTPVDEEGNVTYIIKDIESAKLLPEKQDDIDFMLNDNEIKDFKI